MTNDNESITFNTEDVTYYAILFKNDLHYVHLHAASSDFDEVHSITKSLYEELEKEIDELAEIALSEGFELDNLSNAKEHIRSDIWKIETDKTYSYDDMKDIISLKGGIFLDILNSTELVNNDNNYYLDYLKYFWNKEVNYKNINRQLK